MLVACGGSVPPAAPLPDPDDVDRCPDPGEGIEIGGFVGTGADTNRIPQRRLVLMGGGREEDIAARQFVEAAVSGDIVVLRTSGSLTSYPEYFIGALASFTPATVVTVRTSNPESGADPAVLCRVGRAEACGSRGGHSGTTWGAGPPSCMIPLLQWRSGMLPWEGQAQGRYRSEKPLSMHSTGR